MSADPLNFFAEDSSDSDEGEDAGEKDARPDKDSEAERDGADKLPSPDSLFKSVGRPSFLDNPNKKFINWDRFVKTNTAAEDENHEAEGYAAIPPPSSLSTSGPVTSKLTQTILGTGKEGAVEFSSPPVTYDNGPVSAGTGASSESPGETVAAARPPEKRPQGEESGKTSAPSAKRAKGELFRVKEKRKRDIGQTSRGKSYVEEEKRILRQQFGSDSVLS